LSRATFLKMSESAFSYMSSHMARATVSSPPFIKIWPAIVFIQ
jgi:hypothetical protein